MRKVVLLLSFICIFSGVFAMKRLSKKVASVPFEVVGTYIIVKVRVNQSAPLRFILDSGLSSTLITELSSEDSLTLNYTENTQLNGLGIGKKLNALTSTGNTLQIGKFNLLNQTIYVPKEDVFNLSKHTGSKINGILGSEFFQGHVVKIDYTNQRISFYQSKFFNAPEDYKPVNISLEGQKMFMSLPIVETDGTIREVKMLIDTGAELAAWFRAYGNLPVQIPDKRIRGYIGQGLNGEIKGYLGRMPEITFGDFALRNLVVSFPDSMSIMDAIPKSGREGTIGSQILSRFNYIVDVSASKIYIKPNYNFDKPGSYNIAGIELIQLDINFPIPEVLWIWENSPAQLAGIQIGDIILEINGQKCMDVNINTIKKIFETNTSRPLRLLLSREGKTYKTEIDMNSKI